MHRLLRTIVVAAAVLLPWAAVAQSPAAPRLFGPSLNVPQALATAGGRNAATAVRERAVSPDLGAVDRLARDHAGGVRDGRFVVDLFPGLDFEATVIDAEVRATGSTVFGTLDVEYGSVVLTYENGILIGSIDFPGGNYTVERGADGHYRVTQRALHLAAPEKEPLLVFGTQRLQPFDVEPDVPADSGRLIDVMIIWTPAAQSAAGGLAPMQALAQASIDNSNLTYLNSGVAQRVRLVHSQQVTYTEGSCPSGGGDAFDCALRAATNGTIPNVHALRDQHGADLVSLFIVDNAFCGLAWLPSPPSAGTSGQGYSVLGWDFCPVGNKSFVHELGHNMGAHHDPYVLGGGPCTDGRASGAYCYSRGIVNTTQRWRTVLAYNNQCPATSPFTNCTRIQYLSTPKLLYTGSPLGTANLHNNAHTLNKTAKAIAGYRPTSALHPVPQRYADVALNHPNFGHIEFLAQAGITSGCTTGFCPTAPVSRRHMAVFVERVMKASNYAPPAATGTLFSDVPISTQFASFMERLYADQITGGCAANPLRYCPDADVSRAQMAVFVLRAKCGAAYVPNAPAVATFSDVPTNHAQFRFIEKLVAMGITSGCATGPLRFCPDAPVTRAQMAVFLERAYPMSTPTETCAL